MTTRGRWRSWLWLAVGHLALAIGVIGIAVPLLPTTPFLLIAAGCYARGSERFHRWLLFHPRFGPPVRHWQAHGVIPVRVKIVAMAFLWPSLSYPLLFRPLAWWLKAIIVATGIGVSAFLLSRPSRPRDGG